MTTSISFLMAITVAAFTYICPSHAIPTACDSNTVQGNCVKYARTQVALPAKDLTTYDAKLSIINHRFPRVGSAAIMPAPGDLAAYGHVAVVRNVVVRTDGGLQLVVEESNYGDCAITKRTVTPESRGIRGYFDPAYPWGQSNPAIDRLSVSSGPVGKQFNITVTGGGFDAATARGIIMGGWCDSFGKCAIPNEAITDKSAGSLTVPVTLNSPGTYTLYIFNVASGKTSNGKPVTVG
jgi:hypothetical protein